MKPSIDPLYTIVTTKTSIPANPTNKNTLKHPQPDFLPAPLSGLDGSPESQTVSNLSHIPLQHGTALPPSNSSEHDTVSNTGPANAIQHTPIDGGMCYMAPHQTQNNQPSASTCRSTTSNRTLHLTLSLQTQFIRTTPYHFQNCRYDHTLIQPFSTKTKLPSIAPLLYSYGGFMKMPTYIDSQEALVNQIMNHVPTIHQDRKGPLVNPDHERLLHRFITESMAFASTTSSFCTNVMSVDCTAFPFMSLPVAKASTDSPLCYMQVASTAAGTSGMVSPVPNNVIGEMQPLHAFDPSLHGSCITMLRYSRMPRKCMYFTISLFNTRK